MTFLSYAYRFVSNFVFLALVYFSLNFLDIYPQRVMVAVLVLVYAGMHAASGAAFVLFLPAHRAAGGGGATSGGGRCRRAECFVRAQAHRQRISGLCRAGEMKAYIDLLFLALVILLCVAKIVTN